MNQINLLRDGLKTYLGLAAVIVGLMKIPQPPGLSLDRTEWSFGSTRFNILMLGVVDHGVAIPLMWQILDKKGNSDTDERLELKHNEFL